jgi:hypothetical protein
MVTLDKEMVERLAFLTVQRKEYEKRRDGSGVYNWWIHFNVFGYSLDFKGLTSL